MNRMRMLILLIALALSGTSFAPPWPPSPECVKAFYLIAHSTRNYNNRIPRVGTYGRAMADAPYGLGEFEVPLFMINPIHQVPRNDTYEHWTLDDLAIAFQTNGYRILHAVPLMIMPDGKVFSGGGHHRTETMRRLNEESIPGRIYFWEWLSDDVRDFYLSNYPELAPYR